MTLYPALVFLHVLGATAIFAATGIAVLALRRLQQAQDAEDARRWLALFQDRGGAIGGIGLLIAVGTGLAMMVLSWGVQPWMLTTLAGIVAWGALTRGLSRGPVSRLEQALGSDADTQPDEWQGLVDHRGLRLSLWVPAGILVGIIGLMTVKPGTAGSLVIMAAGAVAGYVLAFAPINRGRVGSAA